VDKKPKTGLLMVPGMTKHQQESSKTMTQMNVTAKTLHDESAAATPMLTKDKSVFEYNTSQGSQRA
jgi:hypothetical protein